MSSPPHEQVSGKVLSSALEALEARQWRARPDWSAAGLDDAAIRGGKGWFTWDEYLRFLAVLSGPDADDARVREVGCLIMEHASQTPFRHLGSLFGGVRALYDATYGWILSGTIRVIESTLTDLDTGVLRIELVLDPSVSPGDLFFHSAAGTMSRLPLVLGMGAADVQAEITSHRARFEVRLPPDRHIAARVRRAWSALSASDGVDTAVEHLRDSVAGTVTHLRDLNRRLAGSEGRWKALTEHLPGVVLVVDRLGWVQAVHGAERDGAPCVVGDQLLAGIPETDRRAVAERFAAVGASGATAHFELCTGLGSAARWWDCRAALLPSEDDRVIVVTTDVTARRRDAMALRDSEQRFMQAQKLEAVGRLAGGVAHDFNNVLCVVQGYADVLRDERGDDAVVQEMVEGIQDAVMRANGLTRQLLAYERPAVATEEVIDINQVVGDAGELLRRLIGDDVRLELRRSDGPLPVMMDPTRLEQVVLNLAVNARDAMIGGGTLGLRTWFEVKDGAQPAVVIEVEDDGSGMSEDVVARALDPFFTTKPVGAGSGLGLSTVHGIAQAAGGSVAIRSVVGEGTCVQVRLPLAEEGGARAQPPPEAEQALGSVEGRVLLVEDQPEVRETVARMLTARGYSVTGCADGDAAMTWVRDGGSFDLLLSDVRMPGMSGVELAQSLLSVRPGLPVVLMSGHILDRPEEVSALTERFAFLTKPFALRRLNAELQRLLRASAGGA